MLTGNLDVACEFYGKQDSYFDVCTEEQFQAKNLSDDALKVFIQSGETHVNSMLHMTDYGGNLGAIFFFQKQAVSTEYVY